MIASRFDNKKLAVIRIKEHSLQAVFTHNYIQVFFFQSSTAMSLRLARISFYAKVASLKIAQE